MHEMSTLLLLVSATVGVGLVASVVLTRFVTGGWWWDFDRAGNPRGARGR